MNSTGREITREILLQYYRELKQKGKLSEKLPSIGIIFGDFLAKAGHKRFFIHECEFFVNIKRNAGRIIITFSVCNESSGKIDEFIAGWHLFKNGREGYIIQKMLDLDDISNKKARKGFDASDREVWNHYENIFRKFIKFLKRGNFMCFKKY